MYSFADKGMGDGARPAKNIEIAPKVSDGKR